MARGVSKSFIKEWKQRLDHANRVWDRRGIRSPDSQPRYGSSTTNNESLKLYLESYRGMPWADAWGGIDGSELSVTPTFFSAANTFVAQLLARNPEPEVLPRVPEKAENARVWEAVLKYDCDELKMKRQWNAALFDAFFAGFGIVRHGFTPSEEFATEDDLIESYSMARPDKPWLRRIRPWDFRFDPLAESCMPDGDAMWCAFRTLVCKDEAEKNPKMRIHENIPTVKIQMAEGAEEPEEFIPLWTVYDKGDKTWFQQAEGDEDRLVRQPADWPIPWEDLPYDACAFNPQMDSPFPVPYAAMIFQSYIERNKVRTLSIELIKRMRRIILVRQDAISEEAKRRLQNMDLTEILFVDGDLSQAIGQVQVAGMDPSLLAYDSVLEKDIREAIGQTAMDRGQRINVESGTEAANVAQGGMVNASRNVEAVEDFLASSMRHYAIARQATTFGEEIIPIVGMGDSALINGQNVGGVTINADTLSGEFDFKIRAGSTLPETHEKRTREAVADIGIAAQAPEIHNLQEAFACYWRARGKNPAKYMLNPQQMQQTGAAVPQAGEGADQGGNLAQMLAAMQQGGGMQ